MLASSSSSSSQVDAPLQPALTHYKVRSPAQPIRMQPQQSTTSVQSPELSSSDKSSPGNSSFDDTLPPTPSSARTTFSNLSRRSPSIHIEEYYPGMAIGDRAFGDPDQISLYQQKSTPQHIYTSTSQKSPYKSLFDMMKPVGRVNSTATSISEHSQEIEVTSTHTRSSLPKQPRALAASKWTQLEFVSHPPPSAGKDHSSSRKFLSSRSISNLRGGKTQTHGALKLVVKPGHSPADVDNGDNTSVFTAVTTSSKGSGDDVILPYGRGGAARAPTGVETRVYGDLDDPAETAYMDQSREVKSGKSGGKQFVQGLFGKKDKSLANLSISNTGSGTHNSSAHGSRNTSAETISAQSTHSGRSVHSDDYEQYNPKPIMYGRGGAGRKESKSTRLQHIQEEKEVLAQIAAEQKAVEGKLRDKLPAYGRGGAARNLVGKPQKEKGKDKEEEQ